jgi:hypothetical protein
MYLQIYKMYLQKIRHKFQVSSSNEWNWRKYEYEKLRKEALYTYNNVYKNGILFLTKCIYKYCNKKRSNCQHTKRNGRHVVFKTLLVSVPAERSSTWKCFKHLQKRNSPTLLFRNLRFSIWFLSSLFWPSFSSSPLRFSEDVC